MDPNKKANLYWTNERHVHFLNSIEASFVRALLENDNAALILPLDRPLPDSTDSTRRRRFSISDINMSSGSRIDVEKKTRTSSSSISEQDQVVPQYKHGRGDKDADGHSDVTLT
ncbi:unnamed protein product [Withania somnifera]